MAIRVLHVIDHLGFGGAEVYVKNLAENIDKNKVESLVCALRTNPDAISINAKLISLKYSRYDPRTIPAVAKLCAEHNIDILHAHLHKSIASCLLASLICKKPLVVHEHGGIVRKGLTFSIYRLLLKLLRHRASTIIANSEAMARELAASAGIDRAGIKVIYNAVDFGTFDPGRFSRRAIRQKLGISDSDFVLGFVGRLNHVKGVDLLIKALSLLLKKSNRYLLLIAGDGPQHRSLESLVKRLAVPEKVRFLGTCRNVAELMAGFDVGVVPSRQEPFGIVVLELMRMKVPVVCSGVEGMAELASNGVTTLVTQQNTPAKIAQCIERLAEDGDLRERLTQAAYNFSERFGLLQHVKLIEQLYLKIVL